MWSFKAKYLLHSGRLIISDPDLTQNDYQVFINYFCVKMKQCEYKYFSTDKYWMHGQPANAVDFIFSGFFNICGNWLLVTESLLHVADTWLFQQCGIDLHSFPSIIVIIDSCWVSWDDDEVFRLNCTVMCHLLTPHHALLLARWHHCPLSGNEQSIFANYNIHV